MVLDPSPGDRKVLAMFPHPLSVIYNSAGQRRKFDTDGSLWEIF